MNIDKIKDKEMEKVSCPTCGNKANKKLIHKRDD